MVNSNRRRLTEELLKVQVDAVEIGRASCRERVSS